MNKPQEITEYQFSKLSPKEQKEYFQALDRRDPNRKYIMANESGQKWPDLVTYSLYRGDYDAYLRDQEYLNNFYNQEINKEKYGK